MRDEKPTVVMCYRTGCDNKPTWAVKNVPTGKTVKCCDEHLAPLSGSQDFLRWLNLTEMMKPENSR